MDNITIEVGLRIRMHRIRLGLTQEALAEKANLHPTYIGQVERGEKSLTLNSLERILNALGISFSNFFENIEACQNTESIPAKCYQLIRDKNGRQQETLYKILREIDSLITAK